MSRVLVLAAHPDDAELGAGGLLSRAEDGWIWIATGASDSGRYAESLAGARALDARAVTRQYPDGGLEGVGREMIRDIELMIEQVGPTVVAIPPEGDTHQDHRALRAAALSALRRSQISVIEYQSPSAPAGWGPDYFVTLSEDDVARAGRALACHKSQSSASYFSPGLQEARYRSAGALVGATYAEPYRAHRIVS